MALSAPIPIIEGSQTEFSKVWIRGSTATSTLPNLKFYKADGRIVHPIAAALNITIVHTAADTLYNRIQAAITASDATKDAAWVAKWFGKHRIVGVVSDAITGDTLLVNRAETSGMTVQNEEPVARTAADFYAQETYAVGKRFTHGIVPGDLAGLNGATVNVSGEVETAAASKTLTGSITLGATGAESSSILVTGLNSIAFTKRSGTGSPNMLVLVSADSGGTWNYPRGFSHATGANIAAPLTNTVVATALGGRIVVDISGYTHVKLVWSTAGSGSGDQIFDYVASGIFSQMPFSSMDTSGRASVAVTSTITAHDAVVNSTAFFAGGGEARATSPTAVASGDWVRAQYTLLGKGVIYPYAIPASTWNYAAASGGIADTTPVQAKAGVASTYNYVTSAQIVNQSTTAVEVEIRSGTTALWRMELDADGGAAGVSIQFPVPLRGAVAEAINIYASGTGKVFANLQGFSAVE